MVPEPIWVAELRISDRTAQKLSSVHGLQADDVRDAVQCVKGLPFTWDDDLPGGFGSSFAFTWPGGVATWSFTRRAGSTTTCGTSGVPTRRSARAK